ncbi:DNA-processing protein DprA [Arenimonas composti]|uniref:Uncharacterized protein n=1 Tax=Arenimonas composti TR7-09 = DSM 18010 TaxID=1121013 RepID=A0A091BGG6_9GAMM|nr:DNA-processing protein DprA [Arenimonas composti]KFN49889.1 hypothetical protein P873_08580 [Arenimonas composti TR7-09 = DSM 18010]
MNAERALLVLSRARLPDAVARALLQAWPDPVAALEAARHGGAGRLDAGSRQALMRPDPARLDADLAWLGGGRRRVLACSDPDYPALLAQTPWAPPLLFVDGDVDLLWFPQIAIVGSRRPSAAGRERAFAYAAAFAGAGWAVTSGLAGGIDTQAHLGALTAWRTVAVVGTGPDRVFPPGNTGLQARIAAAGTVVSEHPPGTPAIAAHFPSRNRIIAGLSLATLVVEAALRSGALITARLAAEAGREVFAIPGSPDNPLARGCHRLIRAGAGLVEEPADVVSELAPVAASLADQLRGRLGTAPPRVAAGAAAVQPGPTADHSRLWSALGHDPIPLDVLVQRTGLTVATLSSILLTMELDGQVVVDNGRYARRS